MKLVELCVAMTIVIMQPQGIFIPMERTDSCRKIEGGSCTWTQIQNQIYFTFWNQIVAIKDPQGYSCTCLQSAIDMITLVSAPVVATLDASDYINITQLKENIDKYLELYTGLSGFLIYNFNNAPNSYINIDGTEEDDINDIYNYIIAKECPIGDESNNCSYVIMQLDTHLNISQYPNIWNYVEVTKDDYDELCSNGYSYWDQTYLVVIDEGSSEFGYVLKNLNATKKKVPYFFGFNNTSRNLSVVIYNALSKALAASYVCDSSCSLCNGPTSHNCVQCIDPNLDLTDNKECICPSNSALNVTAQACVCTDPLKEMNYDNMTCECNSNSIVNGDTGGCLSSEAYNVAIRVLLLMLLIII